MHSKPIALLVALLAVAAAGSAHASVVRSTHAEAELVSPQAALVPGASLALGLRIKLDPGWHVYWKNPGDSGEAPRLALRLPDGFRAGELEFPYPKRLPVAHLVNFGYEGEALFPVKVEVPAGLGAGRTLALKARAEWLECSDICLPAEAELELALPVAATAGASRWTALFGETRAKLPGALSEGNAVATASGRTVELGIPALARCSDGDFFPEREGTFTHARIRRIAGDGLRFTLPLESDAPDTLAGIATCVEAGGTTRAYAVSVRVARLAPAAPHVAGLTLGVAFAFALLGGLALNLMPCVFPVLGIKALALAHSGGAGRGERLRHAGGFAAGVVLSFVLLAAAMLALRSAGEQIGWGFQLQSPAFVSALAALFFVLALNLSGYFEWGGAIQSAAASAAARHGGPFFDGALAVLVASPCTAPLMGAALGYTLGAPAPAVMAVFVALALGMAAPYALLALNPAWTRWLPKSGSWLETLKQLFAFPLYATVLWLGWVLGELAGHAATIRLGALLLAIAFAIWLWRRTGARMLAAVTALAAIAATALWLHAAFAPQDAPAPAADGLWRPYSRAGLDELRARGTPVFVDFTAAWCITCQVNKQAVLATEPIRRALRESGAVAVRADWTRRDPEITRALAELGRNGVPVYAVYGRGGDVTILPEILTVQRVVDALKGAAR